jgi:hypothetical protein
MMMAEDFSSCLSPKLSFPLFTIFIYSLAVSSSFTGWEGEGGRHAKVGDDSNGLKCFRRRKMSKLQA